MRGDTVRMRFIQCGMGTSPLLIYEVYIVCSQPLILDTASEMMFSQCAVDPSSLRDEVYQCATGPFKGLGLTSVQWTPPPPPDHFREIRFTSPSVEFAPYTPWVLRFT